MKYIDDLSDDILKMISLDSGIKEIWIDEKGLLRHIEKRNHLDVLPYYPNLSDILKNPDYVGINPREKGVSMELIKTFDKNVLVALKLHSSKGFYYIPSMYLIQDYKLSSRINSGRLKKLTKK